MRTLRAIRESLKITFECRIIEIWQDRQTLSDDLISDAKNFKIVLGRVQTHGPFQRRPHMVAYIHRSVYRKQEEAYQQQVMTLKQRGISAQDQCN